MSEKNKFLFSVVIPVYNVEQYLAETIESVLAQDIGFRENIQIILVNDGSPDNSEEICLKYKEQYPDNIIYVRQENAGVSAARNTGMKYIEGKYVNFLDSDDKWNPDAFKTVWNFFEEHEDEIDVVACRLRYFEASSGCGHPLNFKFNKDRVISTEYDYQCIQMHMASCFIRREALKYKFDVQLKYGEDSLLINQLILQKQKYGVLRSVDYMYRKRENANSALDTCQERVEFYETTLTHFHDVILSFAKELWGTVPYYVQYLIMYDFQWRVKRPIPEGILTETEAEIYTKHIKSIIKNIDDFIIAEQKNIWVEHKVYALTLKYGYDIREQFVQRQGALYFNNIRLLSLNNPSLVRMEEVKVYKDHIHLEGFINSVLKSDDYEIYCQDGENRIIPFKECYEYGKKPKNCVEGIYYYEKYFKTDIPFDGQKTVVKVFIVYKKSFPVEVDFNFTPNCTMNKNCKNSYLRTNGFLVQYSGHALQVEKDDGKKYRKIEKKLISELWSSKSKWSAIYRRLYRFMSKFIKKEIWLISDRPYKAGDNGEAFFRYMQTVDNKNLKTYFVLEKSSEDYEKMKSVGKVVPYGSLKYKMLSLFCTNIISSQASDYIVNPFGMYKKYLVDLYHFNFTFLQHGITKDDISDWLNRASKNIKVFVTAGKPEYDSIVQGDYYYGEQVVKLTGFPRYDTLFRMNQNRKKKVLLIPTWRNSLKQCVDPKTDESVYYDGFKDSDYFKFYDALINDERLLDCMREHGYEGLFCMHPLFTKQSIDFHANDVFKVNDGYVDYQKEFSEGALLVTDYSSVFFDFAYLKKPVVYSQFDKDIFFGGEHSYKKGYFSYEDDGFGPVCYNLESTVDAVIKEIEHDCQNEEKYIRRIEAFYPYFDENNCQRVYEAILNIPE